MNTEFPFDVYVSHSAKDTGIVRSIAMRLRADGLRVWFADWEIRPGHDISEKTEEGLERSRVLVLCMSANAFGSDWTMLETGTLRFRDPQNGERRFIPVRLDDAAIKKPLSQFLYINWRGSNRELEYSRLLEACRPPMKEQIVEEIAGERKFSSKTVHLVKFLAEITDYSFSQDGMRVLTASVDKTIRLWDLATGRCQKVLEGHTAGVISVVWCADQHHAISGSADRSVRIWEVESGRCLFSLEGHTDAVHGVGISADMRVAVSGSSDTTIRLWDLDTGFCLKIFEGHTRNVRQVALSADKRCIISGSWDATVRIWDIEERRCLQVLEGHTDDVWSVAFSPDHERVLSGCDDHSIRLWDLESGRFLLVLRGHASRISKIAWSPDQRYAVSGSSDKTLRLWDLETGVCLCVLTGHTGSIKGIAWIGDSWAASGDWDCEVRLWDLSEYLNGRPRSAVGVNARQHVSAQVQYTNAKVLLVGDSSAGKTGLSMRLALNLWRPSDSTVGAWATQWKLPVSSTDHLEREIWLWDFGGQADQRLIHQLYMADTALAVLVFDGQKDDLFETLGQWDRDLTRASHKKFTKVLAAGRVDAGGLRASRTQLDTFIRERGFVSYVETSAKANIGCEELKAAILEGIRWADVPWRSSPVLFKRLKEEIIQLKDEDRVLMRFNELRDALRLRLANEDATFTDAELKAVVGLLAGPGVVWELAFGSWVLLQPERINAYAQAVIQTMREDDSERGCVMEERVLGGFLLYHSSAARLDKEEERFILLAMHQSLIERGICLREYTDKGALLVFPSYYRRERPELIGHPAVHVSYRFNGFLDEIYSTLVVRLHHLAPYVADQLWRYAADFRTLTGKQLGVKLTRRAEGAGELEVYFDPVIPFGERIIFSRYVHEHLIEKGHDLLRLRHYVCPHCGTAVGNREVAMERLECWLAEHPREVTTNMRHSTMAPSPSIICSRCENRVLLWDEMEQIFANPETQEHVRELQQQSILVLDNESKERALVGEVISTVALAGQISREFSVSDHGIDMEIEFKQDSGAPSAKKLYLQLKSGDSYLRKRRGDGKEIFTIKKARHAEYWKEQAFPVLLVVRTSDGGVRWMEVRNFLRAITRAENRPVTQIVFDGERFDVMSVRRWRERVLNGRLF